MYANDDVIVDLIDRAAVVSTPIPDGERPIIVLPWSDRNVLRANELCTVEGRRWQLAGVIFKYPLVPADNYAEIKDCLILILEKYK